MALGRLFVNFARCLLLSFLSLSLPLLCTIFLEMKTSISSDVWETKKPLITRLYMQEEWPLKQVIKQIRSDDFNPRSVLFTSTDFSF